MSASQIVPQTATVLGVVASVCVGSAGFVSTIVGSALTEAMQPTTTDNESATHSVRFVAETAIQVEGNTSHAGGDNVPNTVEFGCGEADGGLELRVVSAKRCLA